MKVTSTEFQKNQGRVVRLVPGDKASKVSRLIRRATSNGTPEDPHRGQEQLDAEMRAS
jgi:hypothetical protein